MTKNNFETWPAWGGKNSSRKARLTEKKKINDDEKYEEGIKDYTNGKNKKKMRVTKKKILVVNEEKIDYLWE